MTLPAFGTAPVVVAIKIDGASVLDTDARLASYSVRASSTRLLQRCLTTSIQPIGLSCPARPAASTDVAPIRRSGRVEPAASATASAPAPTARVRGPTLPS